MASSRPELPPACRSDEEERVYLWRFAAGREAGLSHGASCRFAEGDASIHSLRLMAEAGATPEMIRRALL